MNAAAAILAAVILWLLYRRNAVAGSVPGVTDTNAATIPAVLPTPLVAGTMQPVNLPAPVEMMPISREAALSGVFGFGIQFDQIVRDAQAQIAALQASVPNVTGTNDQSLPVVTTQPVNPSNPLIALSFSTGVTMDATLAQQTFRSYLEQQPEASDSDIERARTGDWTLGKTVYPLPGVFPPAYLEGLAPRLISQEGDERRVFQLLMEAATAGGSQ